MRTTRLPMLVCVAVSSLLLLASLGLAEPIDRAYLDLGDATIEDVYMQTTSSASNPSPPTAFKAAPAVLPFTTSFDGYIAARSAGTRLAVLADAETALFADGEPVWDNLGTLSTGPLFPLAYALAPLRAKHVRMEYTCSSYSPVFADSGFCVSGGCTLYSYEGGADIVEPEIALRADCNGDGQIDEADDPTDDAERRMLVRTNEVAQLVIAANPSEKMLDGYTVTIWAPEGAENMRVWAYGSRPEPVRLPKTFAISSATPLPDLYVQPIEPGDAILEVVLYDDCQGVISPEASPGRGCRVMSDRLTLTFEDPPPPEQPSPPVGGESGGGGWWYPGWGYPDPGTADNSAAADVSPKPQYASCGLLPSRSMIALPLGGYTAPPVMVPVRGERRKVLQDVVPAGTVHETVRESFTVTHPTGGDCPCNIQGSATAECGSVTFVSRVDDCPSHTFDYDWNTCSCDNGERTITFTASNCGWQQTIPRTETVRNVRVLSVDCDKCIVATDCSVTFTAEIDPSDGGASITWTGGGDPATGSGQTFTTKWSQPGGGTVTATGDCGSSKQNSVPVLAACNGTFGGPTCSTQQINCELEPNEWGFTGPEQEFPYDFEVCLACDGWHLPLTSLDCKIMIMIDTKGKADAGESASCDVVDDLYKWYVAAKSLGSPLPSQVNYAPIDCIVAHEEDHVAFMCDRFKQEFEDNFGSKADQLHQPQEKIYCNALDAIAVLYPELDKLVAQFQDSCEALMRDPGMRQAAEERAHAVLRDCVESLKTAICDQLQDPCEKCDGGYWE